jgi:hypothetical protein
MKEKRAAGVGYSSKYFAYIYNLDMILLKMLQKLQHLELIKYRVKLI